MTNRLLPVRIREIKSKYSFKVLLGCLVAALACISAPAQSKVDIEITLQLSRDTARGGEEVPFTATVRNIGQAKATRVILVAGQYGPLNIIAGESDLGTCVLGKASLEDKFRCEFGDMAPKVSATIKGTIKIADWDESINPSANTAALALEAAVQAATSSSNPQPVDERSLLGRFSVTPAEPDDNSENNEADFRLKLLASANRAPRLKILSPKDQATLIRPSGERLSYTVTIEASDDDGKVVAVKVVEPRYSMRVVGMNERGYVFEYEGVRYSAAELDEFMRKNPPPERLAVPAGRNIYTYVMTDPPYGYNQLVVSAVDNGGRTATNAVMVLVKSDSTIEIASPKRDQIFSPGSTVVVETISTFRQGRPTDVIISGDGIGGEPTGPVKMELVSKLGNVYRHRFYIKDAPENFRYGSIQVTLMEESGGYTDASVGYLVRELPKISFTSLKDGDTVQRSEKILITYDIENRGDADTYELFIDGKYHTTLYSESIYWLSPERGRHTMQIVASFSKVKLSTSPVVTVDVK